MFKLDTEFYKLPLQVDAERLAREVNQFPESDWRPHPQGNPGNSALLFVTVGGTQNDEVKGAMRPTPLLERCPYIRQILASFKAPIGRCRLMRIAGQGDAVEHVDTNYYWMHHIRIHIPAVTHPEVRFLCDGKSVHMAPGEVWIFDSWKRHNVLNPADYSRIHLVVDTVGSADFWDMVARSEKPFAESVVEAPRFINGSSPETLAFEEENFPLVMSPFEQQELAARMLEGLSPEDRASEKMKPLLTALHRLHQQWHALWAQHRDAEAGWGAFQDLILNFDSRLPDLTEGAMLVNHVPLIEALRQAIVRPALNPEVAKLSQPKPVHMVRPATPSSSEPVASRRRFDRPVFIVSAPRSGSSMLFEMLAKSPDVWTVGGESHLIIEGIQELSPASHDFESNALSAEDASPEIVERLRGAFLSQLRNRHGNSLPDFAGAIRFLEKTPKNSLRIPFLSKVFPEAKFIYLYREPQPNISSILEAWKSERFVTYGELPGWSGRKWSMVLVPGWRALGGKPLAEIATEQWVVTNERIMNELSALPQESWCAISYEEVVRDPQSAAQRLSDFAGWGWDQKLVGDLPHSTHTLTPPDPEKWRANEAEIAPFLARAEPIALRAADILQTAAPIQTTQQPPLQPPRAMSQELQAKEPSPAPQMDFSSEHTANFPDLLKALGVTLAVSTYQAGKLIFVRAQEGVLNTHFRNFPSPMGLAYRDGVLAVGGKHDVWKFRNFQQLGPKVDPNVAHDAVFLPAVQFTTGDIRIHEIAWAGRELWAVNTRFSCLCTFDGYHNFVPRWRPPFISELKAEDRCHLNGMAMHQGAPAFVTCHAPTDTQEGWRGHKVDGGCIVNVQNGEFVTQGLSMPHSPRIYHGKLWFLESGHGAVRAIDLKTGAMETVADLPGFTRGLDFFGQFAFVGLSQVRETAVFSGIPISESSRERHCGVWVIDITTGQTVAFLRFSGSVQEIFAVQVLPFGYPELINEDHELIGGSFFVPPEVVPSAEAPAVPASASEEVNA